MVLIDNHSAYCIKKKGKCNNNEKINNNDSFYVLT